MQLAGFEHIDPPSADERGSRTYTIARYLAQAGRFGCSRPTTDPTAGSVPSSFMPNVTVAADGERHAYTVQAALNAVTGSVRRYILVKPGTYREAVSPGVHPQTLRRERDATQVVIVQICRPRKEPARHSPPGRTAFRS